MFGGRSQHVSDMMRFMRHTCDQRLNYRASNGNRIIINITLEIVPEYKSNSKHCFIILEIRQLLIYLEK